MEDDARLDYVKRYPGVLQDTLNNLVNDVSSLRQDISIVYCSCRFKDYKGIGFQDFRLGIDYGAVAYIVRVKPVFEALKSKYCADASCDQWDISSSPFPVSDYILYAGQNVKVHVPNIVSHGHPFDETSLETSIHTTDEAKNSHFKFIRRSHRLMINYLKKHCSVFDSLDFLSQQIAYQLE
mmetsp:Transcript_20624/g.26299  ORF Transcript_20624/g.26299 Transcript_20624/m.26299 type:complete len:181 (-) Transcript_20624:100-642(-)